MNKTHAIVSTLISQLDIVDIILDFVDIFFLVFGKRKHLIGLSVSIQNILNTISSEKAWKICLDLFLQKADERYQCSIKRQPRSSQLDCAIQHVTPAKQHTCK